MIIYHELDAQERTLLVLVDKELLGKTFEEDGKQLDFTKDFYKGEDKDPENEEDKQFLLAQLHKECIVNASGKETLGFLRAEGFLSENGILTIQGIPTAQLILLA